MRLPTTVPAINYIKLDALASPVRQTVTSATTTTLVPGLWPKTDGYAAWPGGCPDSDPAGSAHHRRQPQRQRGDSCGRLLVR